jgi:plasmid stabilization system protein ParE
VAWKVKWTQTAVDDLEKVADYIAKDSPGYSSIVVHEAITAAKSLNLFANRGRVVPETQDPHIRELFILNYRLIYQISSDTAFILGFVHGARDLWNLWKKKGGKST